jgi:hypothetical protein
LRILNFYMFFSCKFAQTNNNNSIDMSKKFFFLTISILAIVIFTAIMIFRPREPKIVQTELISVTDKQYLTADTTRGAISIDISIEFPVFYQNDEVLQKISNQIFVNLFGKKAENISPDSLLKHYVGELKAEYLDYNSEFVSKIKPGNKVAFNNFVIIEGFSLLSDENIYAYGISREIDLGGNYPARTNYYFNFNLKNGNIIRESDIFIEGYEQELTELIRKKIIELSKTEEEIPEIKSFEDTEYILEAIKPNGNFYINDEGICYLFNPYEIAPVYYMQGAEICLLYPEIKHLMKPEHPLSYLISAINNNNQK